MSDIPMYVLIGSFLVMVWLYRTDSTASVNSLATILKDFRDKEAARMSDIAKIHADTVSFIDQRYRDLEVRCFTMVEQMKKHEERAVQYMLNAKGRPSVVGGPETPPPVSRAPSPSISRNGRTPARGYVAHEANAEG